MLIRAVIPIRSFQTGKSRLRLQFDGNSREVFVRNLACHVVNCVKNSKEIDAVAVLSADQDVLDFANSSGITGLSEINSGGLNAALEEARRGEFCRDADAILYIFADLPELTCRDILQMTDIAKAGHSVVIAPDRHRRGTNALLFAPPDILPFIFGHKSFNRYSKSIQRAGLQYQIYDEWGTAFDVDDPEDLALLNKKRQFS